MLWEEKEREGPCIFQSCSLYFFSGNSRQADPTDADIDINDYLDDLSIFPRDKTTRSSIDDDYYQYKLENYDYYDYDTSYDEHQKGKSSSVLLSSLFALSSFSSYGYNFVNFVIFLLKNYLLLLVHRLIVVR